MTVLLDFESRSRCDLKRHGGRNYWEHPTTEALCVVGFDTRTGEVTAWFPGEPMPAAWRGRELAAHNARGFDRFAAWRTWGVDPASGWLDTSELARTAGLPGALDALGSRWLRLPKDKIGSAFTKSLSRPSRAKATCGQLPELTPSVMDRVLAYCSSDVEIMAHGWPLLEAWRDLEPDVLETDHIVNDRGVRFDSQLAQALLKCDEANAYAVLYDVGKKLGLTAEQVRDIAQSPAQLSEVTELDNAQADTVSAVLNDPDRWPAFVVELCRARQAVASIARGKLEAGLARVSPDGRLRDSLRYYGGHTGRWSHHGMQLGNMPRPAKRFEEWTDDDICRLADAVLAGRHVAAPDEIDLLLRATLCASSGHTLAVSDFAGVEARALAWAAGDWPALDTFASGRDPYKVMAATIYACGYDDIGKDERRTLGKITELACGYGMGHVKFGRDNRKLLEAADIDPYQVVSAWRELHRASVRFWYQLQDAFVIAAQGREAQCSCFTCTPSDDGRDVAIFLPSGRPIVYNNVRLSSDTRGRPQISYEGHKSIADESGVLRPLREKLYGGKLAENVIQAFCRDLMARALVAAERAGLRPVLHVHDEIVCEVPASAEREASELLHAIMIDLPDWAEGFPIGASGHTGKRYRK